MAANNILNPQTWIDGHASLKAEQSRRTGMAGWLAKLPSTRKASAAVTLPDDSHPGWDRLAKDVFAELSSTQRCHVVARCYDAGHRGRRRPDLTGFDAETLRLGNQAYDNGAMVRRGETGGSVAEHDANGTA